MDRRLASIVGASARVEGGICGGGVRECKGDALQESGRPRTRVGAQFLVL